MSFCYTLINPFPAEEEKEELLAAGIHLPARAGTPRCLGGDVFGDRKRLRLVQEGPPLKAECCRWAEGRLLSPRTVALLAPRASDEGRLFRNPPCPAPSSRGSALTPHALQQTAQGGTQRGKGGGRPITAAGMCPCHVMQELRLRTPPCDTGQPPRPRSLCACRDGVVSSARLTSLCYFVFRGRKRGAAFLLRQQPLRQCGGP